jgi:ribosome-binding protein aMBF1 (putative translation factor)
MITPLASYMDREGINDADLAALIGRDRSMVNKLRRGRARPTLDLAAAIERETKGAVPMNAWVEAA